MKNLRENKQSLPQLKKRKYGKQILRNSQGF